MKTNVCLLISEVAFNSTLYDNGNNLTMHITIKTSFVKKKHIHILTDELLTVPDGLLSYA